MGRSVVHGRTYVHSRGIPVEDEAPHLLLQDLNQIPVLGQFRLGSADGGREVPHQTPGDLRKLPSTFGLEQHGYRPENLLRRMGVGGENRPFR